MVTVEDVDNVFEPVTSPLPDSVRRISIDFYSGSAMQPPISSISATAILKSASTKLQQVTIKRVPCDPLSPEDLELLSTAISISESLIMDDWHSDIAYSCLGSCLSQADGVKDVRCNNHYFPSLKDNQIERLCEGIKNSSCIESLSLSNKDHSYGPYVGDSQLAGNALLEALRLNRSLKSVSISHLRSDTETLLPNIFHAAILDTKVQSLSVGVNGRSPFRNVPWNVWKNVLCHEDCSVETLCLCNSVGIGPTENPTVLENDARHNTSVTNCSFFETSLDMTRIVEICGLFQSLVSLTIRGNDISDLSPLDPLLIGENSSKLQNLCFAFNHHISPEHVSEFFRKIPQMACIRKVDFRMNFGLHRCDQWTNILDDVIPQSKSLECLLLAGSLPHPSPVNLAKVDLALAKNLGGIRRVRTLTEGLLPLVLGRAANLSYCQSGVHFKRTTTLQADVVFGLLHEMVSFSLLGT